MAYLDTLKMPVVLTAVAVALFAKVLMMAVKDGYEFFGNAGALKSSDEIQCKVKSMAFVPPASPHSSLASALESVEGFVHMFGTSR
ncbi:hypothetical protein C5167_014945 [Papaver somniferum]|uniref:Uncharacterized protein n=1 Tax=Papaver somniferum TaxID=3469 RepID=A0A4Y7J4M0_PAPSO|nr:hypothetical protein C5167_014945 [Papaver somniferum]